MNAVDPKVQAIRNEFADYLEQTSEKKFNMNFYLCSGKSNTILEKINDLITNPDETCGTVGCIAGHAVAYFRDSIPTQTLLSRYHFSFTEQAGKLLGYSMPEADRLFEPHGISSEFYAQNSENPRYKQRAIQMLRGKRPIPQDWVREVSEELYKEFCESEVSNAYKLFKGEYDGLDPRS